MEAKELRIGNWVCSPYEKQPFRVTSGHIEFLCGGGDECSINPIPLTSEILEKAGFEKDKDGVLKLNGSNVIYWLNDGRLQIADGYTPLINCPCKYAHQLQNLYFALTGQDLDIQL